MVYIFDKVYQKRRCIQDAADLRVILNQRIGIIIALPAFVDIFGERHEQRRGIPLLHQIPQMQQPGHSAVSVKIGMQIGDVKVDQRSLEQIVYRGLIVDERNQIPHVFVQLLPTDAGVLHLFADDIDCIVPVVVSGRI